MTKVEGARGRLARRNTETDMMNVCSPTLRNNQFTLVAPVVRVDRIGSGKGYCNQSQSWKDLGGDIMHFSWYPSMISSAQKMFEAS
jgi:hypothetical protein